MDLIGIGQVVVGAALFFATAVYVYYTRRMVQAAKTPIVVPSIGSLGPTHYCIRVDNVGLGVARRIQLQVKSIPEKLDMKWSYHSMLPKEAFSILLPEKVERFEDFTSLDELEFSISYTDIDGKIYSNTETISLLPWRYSIDKGTTLFHYKDDYYDKRLTELMEKIAGSLKELSEKISLQMSQIEPPPISKKRP